MLDNKIDLSGNPPTVPIGFEQGPAQSYGGSYPEPPVIQYQPHPSSAHSQAPHQSYYATPVQIQNQTPVVLVVGTCPVCRVSIFLKIFS